MSRPADPLQAAEGLAALAALLGERSRAAICLTLLDGRAWTAGELARHVGVSAATASEHLDRLLAGGLIAEERQGRHRYVRLAGADAADLVELLAARSQPRTSIPSSYSTVRAEAALAEARTCYDHLAGRLGVDLLDALDVRGIVTRTDGIALTESGTAWLTDIGVDVHRLRSSRRPMLRLCLDWTERRSHLAGGVGASIAEAFFRNGWATRTQGRAVAVTASGRAALNERLGLDVG